jgi:hypothetical protein
VFENAKANKLQRLIDVSVATYVSTFAEMSLEQTNPALAAEIRVDGKMFMVGGRQRERERERRVECLFLLTHMYFLVFCTPPRPHHFFWHYEHFFWHYEQRVKQKCACVLCA